MADAHARVTGRLGVVILTAGPGLTNALTGLAEALLDSSPILIILASASRQVGKAFQLHQIPQDALVRPLTKGIFQPCRPSDVPKAIFQAAALAVKGEPGPAVVEIPSDLLMEQCNCSISSPVEDPVSEDIEAKLDEAATILMRSSSIGIYAGAGAMGSSTELRGHSGRSPAERWIWIWSERNGCRPSPLPQRANSACHWVQVWRGGDWILRSSAATRAHPCRYQSILGKRKLSRVIANRRGCKASHPRHHGALGRKGCPPQ